MSGDATHHIIRWNVQKSTLLERAFCTERCNSMYEPRG